MMFVKDAFIFRHIRQNYTIPSTSVDISELCQNPFPKTVEIEPSPSGSACFVGLPSAKMTAMGGKRKQTLMERTIKAFNHPVCERFQGRCGSAAATNGALIDEICARRYRSPERQQRRDHLAATQQMWTHTRGNPAHLYGQQDHAYVRHDMAQRTL